MIPFSPPRIDQKIVDKVAEVLLSGWITTGPKTKQFENELATYLTCEKVICLNSATAGMELVLRWFGIQPGDEVIIPAYTYCATANVVMHCGATPVMVDINEDDFNISLEKIKAAVSPKTKAIIPVDIGGWPCDYDELMKFVKEESVLNMFQPRTENQTKLGRILVMADAAHSIGAKYKGRQVGAVTDVAVFSFHAVKNLTTAEGGAVAMNLGACFDVEQIYQELNIKSLHGQSKDALAKSKAGGGNWRYDVIEPGFKCNMMDIQAAIGLVELERYASNLERRKAIFKHYESVFEKYSWAIRPTFKVENSESSYHLYMLRIKNISEEQRDEIIKGVFDRMVSVNVHFQPLPLLTAYKSRGYKMEDYPIAYAKYSNEITLPVYFSLSNSDLVKVTSAVVEAVETVLN
ncbi:DegT/DnrJ/EryC1/StrS family aminotransferase [Crocinitomix algicola]|uniref:DegT/DnrJ/EryC1/StrS family aminotransferase n=1 Tax=Crocinitomix algicola TaxID=1740263 RepID=UPI000872ECCB|nr:DegT/DnrJ/EryC1/StrS aminotransferase family protein [Crocinitomix algicola]